MEKCVDEILNGTYDFGRERAPLSFSCAKVNCETGRGSTIYGSFYIMGDSECRGFVHVSDPHLKTETDTFSGAASEISYTVSTVGLKPDSVVTGKIDIISNRGEYEMPFEIRVSDELPDSSMGEIKNLFHFANLAMGAWDEAVELFYSPRFKNILTGPDAEYLAAYRGFSAYPGNACNVERFLETTKKKTAPVYTAEIDKVWIDDPEQKSFDIILYKDGWGYTDLEISCEGSYLSTDKEHISREDFKDGETKLLFYIDTAELHIGKNPGAVLIRGGEADIRIPVTVSGGLIKPDLSEQHLMLTISKKFIDYRTGRIAKADFCRDAAQITAPFLSADPERVDLRLLRAHILLLERRKEDAGRMIELVGALINEETPSAIKAYYIYLKALYAADPILSETLSDDIDEMLQKEPENWRIAWIALFLRDEYKAGSYRRLELIRSLYDSGCRSPFILLEAVHIFLNDPKAMENVGAFEMCVMRFALKYGLTGSGLRRRFAFLSEDIHSFSEDLLGLLISCMEVSDDRDVLEALCTHLMRGNCMDGKYFRWYSEAVEKEIRLTRLYEYYMMSIDRSYEGTLPKIVLMYFAYRSNLDSVRTAFLYANVLRHRREYSEYADFYSQYEASMPVFAKEQLLQRNLDENLAYLYGKLLDPFTMGDDYANAYTELMFTKRFTVDDPQTVNIVLIYDHLRDEFIYPVYLGEALIPVYGDNVSVFLEDVNGCRREAGDETDVKQIITKRFERQDYAAVESPEPGAALFISESEMNVRVDRENERAISWLTLRDDITDEYALRLMVTLAEYYFDNDIIAPLDDLLARFDPVRTGDERERIIRIMVARGLYDEAFEWIKRCGPEGIDYKILLRLADRLLARNDYAYDEDLMNMCRTVLDMGKYDEQSLKYMLMFDTGSLKDKKVLWRAADSFGLDVGNLMSGMLKQMLFTGTDLKEKTDVFAESAESGADLRLIAAGLSSFSYDVLIRGREADPKVFAHVLNLLDEPELITDYTKLAFIRYVSELKEKDVASVDAASSDAALRFIDELWEEGIFMPDFMAFSEEKPELKIYEGRSFVEYTGKQGSHVILHYVREGDGNGPDDYRKEEMLHVFGGIYLKSFILFYGEKIGYYITEENGRQEKLTKASVLEAAEPSGTEEKCRYGMIGDMALALEMDDEKSFAAKAEEYERKKALNAKLFIPGAYGRK